MATLDTVNKKIIKIKKSDLNQNNPIFFIWKKIMIFINLGLIPVRSHRTLEKQYLWPVQPCAQLWVGKIESFTCSVSGLPLVQHLLWK